MGKKETDVGIEIGIQKRGDLCPFYVKTAYEKISKNKKKKKKKSKKGREKISTTN